MQFENSAQGFFLSGGGENRFIDQADNAQIVRDKDGMCDR